MVETVGREIVGPSQVKMFSFFEELAEPVKKLGYTAWESRGKLVHDIKTYVVLVGGTAYSMPGRAARVLNNPKLHALLEEEEDPEALAAVILGLGGALCVGSAGAIIGVATGGTCGAVVGTVPALFTFGLSIPTGAVIGAAGGLGLGATAGGAGGFMGAAISGSAMAYYRRELRYGAVLTISRLSDVHHLLVTRPVNAVRLTTRRLCTTVHDSADYTKAKAKSVSATMRDVASNGCVQATAVGAGVGAAALGTAGATGGVLAGGAVGVAVGLVPALFTFGLSIPVGALVGSSAGLCMGGAAGTAAGCAGGGAVGCLGYKLGCWPLAALGYARDRANVPTCTAQVLALEELQQEGEIECKETQR